MKYFLVSFHFMLHFPTLPILRDLIPGSFPLSVRHSFINKKKRKSREMYGKREEAGTNKLCHRMMMMMISSILLFFFLDSRLYQYFQLPVFNEDVNMDSSLAHSFMTSSLSLFALSLSVTINFLSTALIIKRLHFHQLCRK